MRCMKYIRAGWAFLLGVLALDCHAQKLHKSDRVLLRDLRTHISHLAEKSGGGSAAANKPHLVYLTQQFEVTGLNPLGDSVWYQYYEVNEGRRYTDATFFMVDSDSLQPGIDFFPLPFSADAREEATISLALNESGAPWVKKLGDLLQQEGNEGGDAWTLLRKQAEYAASKGATALIIFNEGEQEDLRFDPLEHSPRLTIPVIYITRAAASRYFPGPAAIVDLKYTVLLEDRRRLELNVLGWADYGRDSTILVTANLDSPSQVAALIELSRLCTKRKSRPHNYIFAVCSDGTQALQAMRRNDGKKGARFGRICRSMPLAEGPGDADEQDALRRIRQAAESLGINP